MIDQKVKAYIIDALKRKAHQWDEVPQNVQLLIQLDAETTPQFKYCKQYEAKQDTTVEEILNLDLDVMGLCQMVPGFIQQKMLLIADELQIHPQALSAIMIIDGTDLLIWLYDRDKPIKSLTLNELLS